MVCHQLLFSQLPRRTVPERHQSPLPPLQRTVQNMPWQPRQLHFLRLLPIRILPLPSQQPMPARLPSQLLGELHPQHLRRLLGRLPHLHCPRPRQVFDLHQRLLNDLLQTHRGHGLQHDLSQRSVRRCGGAQLLSALQRQLHHVSGLCRELHEPQLFDKLLLPEQLVPLCVS